MYTLAEDLNSIAYLGQKQQKPLKALNVQNTAHRISGFFSPYCQTNADGIVAEQRAETSPEILLSFSLHSTKVNS